VTVSWAAAGVADTTTQTAAVDRNVKTKRFIRFISDACDSPSAVALIPKIFSTDKVSQYQYSPAFCRLVICTMTRQVQRALGACRNILQDDLDTTIVSVA
jgi:hypothetical protein